MDRLSRPLPLTETTNNNATLDDLLSPVDSISWEVEHGTNDTEDIFEEVHRDNFLRRYAEPNKMYLTKKEADMRTAEKFTDEFKKTIRAIREETGLNKSLFDEESAIEDLLKAKERSYEPGANFAENRGTPIEIESEEDSTTTSSESNFWRLLSANSTSKFQVSPPIFYTFKQVEQHWLERPPIPWEKVEGSRKKCKKWLDGTTKHDMIRRSYTNKRIRIISDSQAALKALGAVQIHSQAVKDCMDSLIQLAEHNSITLEWERRHQSHEGNERADFLAKKGAEVPLREPEPTCGLAYWTARRTKDLLRDKHISHWAKVPGLRQSRMFIDEPSWNKSENLVETS
ncbi:hypothetical protein NQ318_014067 [Aromia moschata]|uniref:RNase H type-1 domain-containing protein n=1 Tax=Aromia moschata TaxID=1265417 RepID=A0AAV8YYR4_9CUCU|nr:hypothetical protein NQ318_014067 [Aromia moschata]